MPAHEITMAPSARSITLSTGQNREVQMTASESKGAQTADLIGFVIIAYGSGQSLVVL